MGKFLWFFFITVGAFAQGTYNTTFPATENPISQNGKWISGRAATNWNDVRTAGYAFGTAPQLSQFSDSTAVLTGNWKPDQWAEATVKVSAAPDNFHEIALRLRTIIGVKAGSCADTKCITGYEIDCSVSKVNRYIEIVRWNGPIGDFTYIVKIRGTGCNDGDVLKAVIIGHSIAVLRNGTLLLQVPTPHGRRELPESASSHRTRISRLTESLNLRRATGSGFPQKESRNDLRK